MSDPSRVLISRRMFESAPSSRQTFKFLIAGTVGVSLSFLFGLTLTGTVIGLVLATPVLVLFSPILVPAVIALFLVATGLVVSGGWGVATITALSWIYNYVTGKYPSAPDTHTLDYARMKIADTAKDMKDRAKQYGQYVQHKAQDSTQGS